MAYPGTIQLDYGAPYETTTVSLYPLGQKMEDPSGSIFRYTLMGSTVGVANKLYQSSIPVSNWTSQTHTIALAVGDTEISFDDGGTALTVHQAENGSLLAEHLLGSASRRHPPPTSDISSYRSSNTPCQR